MDYLRYYIKSILFEEDELNVYDNPKNKQTLSNDQPGLVKSVDHLALYINNSRHNATYVLYDAEYYAAKLRKEILTSYDQFKRTKLKGKFNDFTDYYSFSNVQEVFRDTKGIYGYSVVNVGRSIGIKGLCYDANEMKVISSRRGYGTLMYLVMMVNDAPIMPNRESVSNSSKRFWEYFDSLEGKIDLQKFSDEEKLHVKTEKDCSVYGDKVLDQAYSLKTEYNLKTLRGRHEFFIVSMRQFFEIHKIDFIKSRVQEYILDAGKKFYIHEARKERSENEKQIVKK